MSDQPRVLFLTTVDPRPESTGGEIASMAFVRALQGFSKVRVLAYQRRGDKCERDPVVECVGERVIESNRSSRHAATWLAGSFIRNEPYTVTKFRSKAYVSVLKHELAAIRPHAIVLEHAQMGWLLPHLPRDIPLAYLTQNAEAESYQEQARLTRRRIKKLLLTREAALIERSERELSRVAKEIWCLTNDDAQAHRGFNSRDNVVVFDVPYSGSMISKKAEKKFDIGLIGTWSWGPNEQGLRWFVNEVIPLLPRELSVGIAGRGAEWLLNVAEVRYLGFVRSASEFLSTVSCVAVPARAGTGIQIKTLEAIVSGRPVVSTKIGLRGISEPPPNVSVGECARDFASALLRNSRTGACIDPYSWNEERRERFERCIRDQLIGMLG